MSSAGTVGCALLLIYWVVHPLQLPLQQGVSNELWGQTLSCPHLVLLLFTAHLPLWVHSLLLHRLVIEAGQP